MQVSWNRSLCKVEKCILNYVMCQIGAYLAIYIMHAGDISIGVVYVQDIEVIVSCGCSARENYCDVCWGLFCYILELQFFSGRKQPLKNVKYSDFVMPYEQFKRMHNSEP